MKALKCDRCGAFFEEKELWKKETENLLREHRVCTFDERYKQFETVDLCPICLGSFAVWWSCPMNVPEVSPDV